MKNTDTITVQQDVHFVCQKKIFSGMFKYNINMRYNYVYIYIYTEYAAANIDDPPDYLHLFTMRHLIKVFVNLHGFSHHRRVPPTPR